MTTLRRFLNLFRKAPAVCSVCGEPMLPGWYCDECGAAQLRIGPGVVYPRPLLPRYIPATGTPQLAPNIDIPTGNGGTL